MLGGKPVVWLTEATTTEWTKADRAKFESRGLERTASWLPDCSARLTIRIGSHDRKLARYVPWLRRHPFVDMPEPSDFEAMEQWWIYLGTIPRDKIVGGLP